MTVTVRYSCDLCRISKRPVQVAARGEEGIGEWMDATLRTVADDHRRLSPWCHPSTLKDLMIPITGTDRVGGPVIQ